MRSPRKPRAAAMRASTGMNGSWLRVGTGLDPRPGRGKGVGARVSWQARKIRCVRLIAPARGHSIAVLAVGPSSNLSASLRPTMIPGSRKTSGTVIAVVTELAITSELNEK